MGGRGREGVGADKMAEVLKRKRKNQRDTGLRVVLGALPSTFYGSSSLVDCYFSALSIISFFFYHFPRLRRAAFHFLIEKGELAFKRCWTATE